MADVASALYSWSTTASSNSPSGATNVGSGLDDNLRQLQATVREGLAHYNSTPVASAGTVDLGAQTGNFLIISGTTTITAFGTVSAGIWKVVRFSGALTLTYNGTSLILPGAANITTVAGDVAGFVSEGSGNWRCFFYEPIDGRTVVSTVLDSEFQILDNSDPTKIAQFQASGITAGQTRTYTLPDASTTVVGHDATQTLTNKTLTAPNISSPVITGTVTGTGLDGHVLQVVNTNVVTSTTGSTTIPLDDTIPQNTEGFEVMTLAITPRATTNKLLIRATVNLSHPTDGSALIAALYENTTANALAAVWESQSANNGVISLNLEYYRSAGTTSEITFKIRVGSPTAGTVTLNGTGGSRYLGGVLTSGITITEIQSS
jgi:hypothetical protein